MSDTYYVTLNGGSSKCKVDKETYKMYMDLVSINSEKLVSFTTPLLSGIIEENPPYYMRDNHTFKKLTGSIDEMIEQIKLEIADGYTYGMLCSHYKKEVVHMDGSIKSRKPENG